MSKHTSGCLLAAGLLTACCAVQAATVDKTNNVDNLNLTTSWKGGVTPKVNDVARWGGFVGGASAVLLGADLSYQGISVVNPGGDVAIGGNNALTNGFQGFNLATAQRDLTLTNANLYLLDYAGQVWNVTNARTLTVSPTALTRGASATLGVQGAGTVASATIANDATGLIGPWARYGTGTSAKYATVSGGFITGYTGAAAATAADVNDTTGVLNYDVAAVGALAGGTSFNTLRYTGAAGTITGAFSANGLLNAGAGTASFSGNTLIGASKELVLTSPDTTRRLSLWGTVSDNGSGPSSVTVAGGGIVAMSASNAYSGVTVVEAGTLSINHANALGTTNGNTVVYSTGSASVGGQLALYGGVTVAEPVTLAGPGDGASGGYTRALDVWGGTNTLSGTVTLTGTSTYRIGAGTAGYMLNLGLIQRSTSGGGALICDPVAGSVLNINTAIDNNAGDLTCHGGGGSGLTVLNVSNNDLGNVTVQNDSSLKITAADALATNRNLVVGQGGVSTTTGTGNDRGVFYLDAASQTVNALNGYSNANATASSTITRRITSTTAGAKTFTVGYGNTAGTFDGVIEDGTGGGTMALTKVGTATQTLTGTRPNTYSGLTTVNGGTLTLSKVPGTNAIPGNVVIGAGTLLNGLSNQIPDAANVTLTTGTSFWNLNAKNETVANVDMQNGANPGITTGGGNTLTVSGALTHTLGTITLNSGGSIISANAVTNMGGTWTWGIGSGDQGILVGSGGLTMGGGSTLDVSATATNRNYLSLGGDVTSLTNANANTISIGAAPYLGQLKLNGARTFNVADGTASSDLTVSAIIVDGTGTGSLVKSGNGTLTLSGTNAFSGSTTVSVGTLALSGTLNGSSVSVASGATFTESAGGVITGTGVGFVNSGTATLSGTNTYTGTTAVNAGVLSITATNALPGWDAAGRYTVASGAALVIGNAVSNTAISVLLGTGNFAAGASIGFDTSAGNRTYAPILEDTVAGPLCVAKVGANTLTLTATNTYTGTLTVNTGSLSIPYTNALAGWDTNGRYLVYSNAALVVGNAVSNAAIASMLGTANFAAGGAIGFDTVLGNRTYASILSNTVNGALGVAKVSANTLSLTGTNTYEGVTTVNVGTLLINNASALGTTNGSTVITSTGNLTSGAQLALSGGITVAEPITITGPGDAAPYVLAVQTAGGGGSNTLTGPVTIATVGGVRLGAAGAGTVLVFNGPFKRTSAVNSLQATVGGDGGLVIFNTWIDNKGGDMQLPGGGRGVVLLNVASNNIGNIQIAGKHELRLGVSDALAVNKQVQIGYESAWVDASIGTFNLAGFNQTINELIGGGSSNAVTARVVTNSATSLSTLTVGNGNGSGVFNGVIGGNLALTKVGTGTQTLGGPGSFTGDTTLSAGVLLITNSLALSRSTLVSANGTLTFGSLNTAYTLGGLAGSKNLGLTNSAGTAVALSVGNNNSDTTYSGALYGAGSLVKIGSGKLTLAGVNTYTGSTTLSNGTLALGCANALGSGTQIILAGGTLDPGAHTNALSALNITAAGGTVALGSGACTLSFADCSAQTWSGALNLTGTWGPTSLRFGTSASGLTSAQLDSLRVSGQRAWFQLDAQGYLWKLTGTLLRVK